jgi:hypothetical protein
VAEFFCKLFDKILAEFPQIPSYLTLLYNDAYKDFETHHTTLSILKDFITLNLSNFMIDSISKSNSLNARRRRKKLKSNIN